MKSAISLDNNDIRKILAEKFNVPEKNVLKHQYSFTVILEDEKESEEDK